MHTNLEERSSEFFINFDKSRHIIFYLQDDNNKDAIYESSEHLTSSNY